MKFEDYFAETEIKQIQKKPFEMYHSVVGDIDIKDLAKLSFNFSAADIKTWINS